MNFSEKVKVTFISLSLIVSLVYSAIPGQATLRKNGFDWFERFRISPKPVNKSVLVTAPAYPENKSFHDTGLVDPNCPEVKGIYITSWKAGNRRFLDEILDFIDKTAINAVVVDVKDEEGRISYPTLASVASQLGASIPKYHPEEIIQKFKEKNIYLIARLVVFKDPFLAEHKPEWAVRTSEGGLWKDRKGLNWVDPYNEAVWDYNLAIAKEAANLGFQEIQFDYIRFTSDGKISDCRYPKQDHRSKAEVISDFLKYAVRELKPYHVRISADVFGLTCSAQDDLGIGQVFEKMAALVDVICPMVYPSHFEKGQYNIPNPDIKPYDIVLRSLTDAKQRLEAKRLSTIIRPWIQDFSLKSFYGRAELESQIRAVKDAGLNEWLFWNPSNKYRLSKYHGLLSRN